MTPSSEELAAALEVALEACAFVMAQTGQGYVRNGGAIVTLRAHLSRLREEAEFRDAARTLAKLRVAWIDGTAGRPGVVAGAWQREMDAIDAFVAAYRALEEPRDG